MIFDFKDIETAGAHEIFQLIGGFSTSYGNDDTDDKDTGEANNCMGGNCAQGCGIYGNSSKLCATNNVAGCG